jgi:membrane-anchored glycerophosphoryl diester phosphodiesterase (GDPDase)
MAATTPPLSLGEILDRTVQLYRRNFMLFVGISLLPAAFDVLVSGGVSIYFTSIVPAFKGTGPAATQALIVFFIVLALFLFICIPLLVAVFSLALSALNFAAFERNRGADITVRASYGYGFRNFLRYLGIISRQFRFAGVIPAGVFFFVVMIGSMLLALIATTSANKALSVLFGLIIFLLVFALIAVAFWIWIRYCLAFPACVTEEKKVWPSMQRSVQLTKGSRGRIFVMYLLVAILTIVIYYVLTIPIDLVLKYTIYKSIDSLAIFTKPPIVLQVVNFFVSFLERSFAMPIYAIALLLFYNDQRTRQEGYDIELLMAQAGWSTLPQPAPISAQPMPVAAVTPFPADPPQPLSEALPETLPQDPPPSADSPEVSGA